MASHFAMNTTSTPYTSLAMYIGNLNPKQYVRQTVLQPRRVAFSEGKKGAYINCQSINLRFCVMSMNTNTQPLGTFCHSWCDNGTHIKATYNQFLLHHQCTQSAWYYYNNNCSSSPKQATSQNWWWRSTHTCGFAYKGFETSGQHTTILYIKKT